MENDNNTNTNTTTTEIKWFGEVVAFNIGKRPVKVWELIVGLVVLSILAPMFYSRRGSRGYDNGGRR